MSVQYASGVSLSKSLDYCFHDFSHIHMGNCRRSRSVQRSEDQEAFKEEDWDDQGLKDEAAEGTPELKEDGIEGTLLKDEALKEEDTKEEGLIEGGQGVKEDIKEESQMDSPGTQRVDVKASASASPDGQAAG